MNKYMVFGSKGSPLFLIAHTSVMETLEICIDCLHFLQSWNLPKAVT